MWTRCSRASRATEASTYPSSGRGFAADTIAGFAGQPYAEVAVEVMRPFVGEDIAEHDLARLAREAYGNFRHPAVAPLRQYGASEFVLELFHGPTLAFKDVALQLIGRLMDHVLTGRGERTTVVVATSGDTGAAAIEAFRGCERADIFVLFPQGRISDVQRRMMTTVADENVHALAVDGTFDDCQAIVKGMFRHHAFCDRVRLAGVNSINWARIIAQIVYYFTAAVALGSPLRKVAFTVPTGNFGNVYAGYVALRMGLPIDRLLIATNVNDILPRTMTTGSYDVHSVVATSSPSMDIQVASNFERLLFEVYSRDANAVRALMGTLAQSGKFTLSVRALSGIRAAFSADRADEEETAATMRAMLRETGQCVRSAYRGRYCGEREGDARPRDPDGRARNRASRQVPRCGRGGLRGAAAPSRLARRPASLAGAGHHRARGCGGGREAHSLPQPRCRDRSRRMSVEVTRLPSGLVVVTDAMPHLESASLGVWVGAGSRDERPDEHGISHLLEHMAFKGTTRRTARQIAEEIEAVGGDLNAATSAETTAYYARVLRADVPLALDVLSDILADPAFDPEELRREQNVIVQEIGAAEDTPDDLVWDRLQEVAFAGQPMGRSILGTRATVRSFDRARLSAYLTRNYRGPDMVIVAAGAVDHAAVVSEVERRFASFAGPAAPLPEPARFIGGSRIEQRELEQVHIALALQGLPQRDPDLYSLQVFTSVLGGGMSSRLFQEVREQRGLCYAIYAFHSPYADSGMFGLYAGTDADDVAELMRVVVGEIHAAAETISDAEVARAKAQMKAGLLMALESSSARAEQLARQIIAWGRPIPLEEIVAKVEAVTLESTRAAGRAVIARGRPALAALGPGPGLEHAAMIADSLAREPA